MKFVLYNEEMRRRLAALGFTHLRYGKALTDELVWSLECDNAICAEIIPLHHCECEPGQCFQIDSSLARHSTLDSMTTFYVRLPVTNATADHPCASTSPPK